MPAHKKIHTLEGNEIRVSTRKHKKYMVKFNDKWIHFGDERYQHYRDLTPIKAHKNMDHNDEKRRALYRKRHENIKDKDGTPFYKKKSSPAYWSYTYLW